MKNYRARKSEEAKVAPLQQPRSATAQIQASQSEKKKRRRLYMKCHRAKQSEKARKVHLNQPRQHMAEIRSSQSEENGIEFSIEKALRIYPTNEQVPIHNEKVLLRYENKGTVIYILKAQD